MSKMGQKGPLHWGPLHPQSAHHALSPGMPKEPGPGRAGELGMRVPTPLPSPALATGIACHFWSCFQSCSLPPPAQRTSVIWGLRSPFPPTPQSCWVGWIPVTSLSWWR